MRGPLEELKPCPFCGNKYPWSFITVFHAVLECRCGARMKDACVRVLYKEDEAPEELRSHLDPANALAMKQPNGTVLEWPDHGYWCVSVVVAFWYAGVTKRWNTRA